MNKILKRLLSVVLAVVMVIGLVPLSRPVTVKALDFIPAGTTIYFDPSDSLTWSQAGIYGFVSSANNTKADLVIMEQVEGTNLYQGQLKAQATNINFKRIDPDTGKIWNSQSTWPALENGKYLYKLNNNGANEWDNVTGYWQSYTPEDYTVSDNNLFYVDTDLVDYYNDARVDIADTATFSTKNQGSWMGNFTEHNGTAFSYLNGKISSYLGNSNRENLPLYFGSLLFINNRVGRENLKGSEYKSLDRWNTTANVALTKSDQHDDNVDSATHNISAAVQGLVYNKLRSDGQLLAPDGNKELPYFSKNLANEWKYGNNSLMKYYEGYQFPFKVSTYENSEVKKYSYDSETDYAVRLSENTNEKKLVALDTPNKTKNTDRTNGYYPFNIVGESNRNNVNYGFGTKFTIPFTVNENGTIDGTENGEPITFSFTGDDDVWVFIDGHLVLDMGGAHAKAEGTIDFKKLTATVKNAATAKNSSDQVVNGNSNIISNYQEKGLTNYVWPDGKNNVATQERSKVETNDSTKTFAELAGDDFAASFQDSSQTHTLVMFYMERGMYDSNMKVEFTINPLPSGLSLSKSLDVTDVNDGLASVVQEAEDDSFSFKIQTKDSETEGSFKDVENLGYTLTKGNKDSELQTAQNSIISGVGAKSYAHSFINTTSEDNAFTSGTSFEITELTENTGTVFEYDYNNTTWTVYDKNANNNVIASSAHSGMNNLVAKFDFPDTGDFIKYDYGVNFTNKPKVGSVSVTKQWKTGETAPTDGEYSFQILVDLDGEANNAYEYLPYELDYTLNGDTKSTDADGNFTLKIGDTVTFAGIPVGASYKIVESIPENANYTSDQPGNTVKGTIEDNTGASVTFTNGLKTETIDKVIYVEAGKTEGTDYTVKASDDATITITDIKPAEGITVVKDDNGTVNFKSDNADKKYEVTYSGTKTDGTIVTGKITVFTYKATNKVYVFDYGLESDLTENNDNGDGLFQGGVFYNDNATGDNGTMAALEKDGVIADENNSQTSIIADDSVTINDNNGTTKGSVTFKPTAFMDKIENYTYKADIIKNGATLDVDNPETGTVVNGTIKVMPASTVYYEDNFAGSGLEINYTGTTQQVKSQMNGEVYKTDDDGNYIDEIVNSDSIVNLPKQSNDQSEQYGHDDSYSNGTNFSAGTSTRMSPGSTATFTFKGTGFDIISRTNTNTGTILVKVKNSDGTFDKTIPLITYYDDGDLYQVPVIHEVEYTYDTYTVTIDVQKFDGQGDDIYFYLDGIRIYNPLEDDEADIKSDGYLDSEELATDQEIRPMILGTTGDNGSDSIVLCQYVKGAGGDVYISNMEAGKTFVERLDNNGDTTLATGSLEDYWKFGPNNELYLEPGNAIAFWIPKEEYDSLPGYETLQVAAKLENGNSVKLRVIAKDGTEIPLTKTKGNESVNVDEISTATTMYYNVPVNDKMLVESSNGIEYYQIIIANTSTELSERVALTNIKYFITPEMPDDSNVRSSIRKSFASAFGTENGTINSTKFSSMVLKGKTATIQVYTSLNVDSVNVYDSDGNLLDLEWTSSTKTMNNNTRLRLWKAKLTAPKKAGKYTYKVTGQIGTKETFEVGEAVLTVK